jgi:hypothetical protein
MGSCPGGVSVRKSHRGGLRRSGSLRRPLSAVLPQENEVSRRARREYGPFPPRRRAFTRLAQLCCDAVNVIPIPTIPPRNLVHVLPATSVTRRSGANLAASPPSLVRLIAQVWEGIERALILYAPFSARRALRAALARRLATLQSPDPPLSTLRRQVGQRKHAPTVPASQTNTKTFQLTSFKQQRFTPRVSFPARRKGPG